MVDDKGHLQIKLPDGPVANGQPTEAKRAIPPRPRTPFDDLKAETIPAVERYDWQPAGLVAVMGEHAWRHGGPVVYTAITADGKTVASGGREWGGYTHVLRLWDRATGREKAVFTKPYWQGFTDTYAVSPDGMMTAVGTWGRV